MPTTEGEAIFTAIANAIRSKDGGTGPIPVQGTGGFAERIKMIPRPATDNVGKVVVYATEQTQAFMNTNKLVRMNGWAAFETSPAGATGNTGPIEARFRRAEWQTIRHPPTGTALPSLGYSRLFQVGDKLYCGAQTASTTIPVINTKTGEITSITGLPSRQHAGFALVGTKLYVFASPSVGGTPSYSIIVRIDTTTDAAIQITLDGGTNRPYDAWALLGNRLYWGWSGTSAATVIPFINTNDDTAGTTTGLPSRAHGGRVTGGDCMFAISNKLYIASTTATDSIAVITASGGTAPNYTTWTVSTITGLPSRINSNWCLAGTFLYVGSGAAAYTSILRIQTATAGNTTTTLTTPSRFNNIFEIVDNKVYVGSNDASSGTRSTIMPVINNSAGTISIIEGLPDRIYSHLRTANGKVYATGRTSATTLVVINTTNDSWFEITGLNSSSMQVGGSGVIPNPSLLHLDGSNLYIVNNSSAASHVVINTVNDTVRANNTGILASWSSSQVVLAVPVSRANPEGGLYLGGSVSAGQTAIMEIDFASVNERGSGSSVPVRQILNLPNPPGAGQMFFANEKIWLSGSQTATSQITCLTKSVLPTHAGFVYVRY